MWREGAGERALCSRRRRATLLRVGTRILSDFSRGVLIAALLLLSMIMIGCSETGSAGRGDASRSLLRGIKPTKSHHVRCASCLTDGTAAREGAHWKSEAAALFRSRDAVVEYDLGSVKEIRAAWLQGDNNDVYRIEISTDGQRYSTLWDAKPVSSAGLRERSELRLSGKGRYLRLQPLEGDGNYSITELQLFSEAPRALPVGLVRSSGIPLDTQVRSKILAFGVALIGLLVLSFQRASWWWLALVGLIPVVAGYDLGTSLYSTWPQGQREVSLVRGTVAIVALAALLREAWSPKRYPAHRGVVLSVLAFCGLVGFLAFYNLGHPQFQDRNRGEPTYVHHLDLRQYYGTAKYFDEIGYRALYEADIAAYLEDHPDTSLERIATRPMRSLRTHQMSTVGAERARIVKAPTLFSKERWKQYKADARYFREAMGSSQYFSTFYDLGGNATPVWISTGHLMFNLFPASNSAFSWTGLLDPLLILAAFVAIGFCFGPRTMFVCMVIFGANDFIMYGSNWGGATLRHDWMAYIAFGACALRREKWVLAGALLALSTSIRAFPALTLITLSFPVIWYYLDRFRAQQQLPTLRALWTEQRPLFMVAAGAAATGVLLFLASSLVVGFEAWADWYVKVSQLSADPHGNHISLRSLIAGWEGDQALVLADRMPLYLLGMLFFTGMLFAASRGQRFEQAAILGLVLTPVFFYPANYYIHLVWLLPLVMLERRQLKSALAQPFDSAHLWVGGLLLGMCAAQYFTVLETDRGIHFYMASVLLFATLTGMLIVLVRKNLSGLPALAHGGAEPQDLSVEAPAPSRKGSPAPDTKAEGRDSDDFGHAAQ